MTLRRGTLWPVFYGLPAMPITLMVVYAKIRWLQLGGLRIAARGLAREEGDLSRWEQFSFVRADLTAGLVVLPFLLAGLAVLLRPRWRPWAVAAVAALIGLAFYLQLRALSSVGTFLHTNLWIFAIRFARERPEYLGSYVTAGGVAKAAVMIGASVVLAFVAGWFDPGRRTVRLLPTPLRVTGWGLLVAGVVAAGLSWLPRVSATSYHRAMLAQALTAYWSSGSESGYAYAGLSPAELGERYRDLAGTRVSPVDSAWWGRARGHDVVIFVLETVPARCLDLAGGLDDLPAMRRLRAHAIVAPRHYTVYPYSSLANFALLSSWYPPEFARSFMGRHAADTVPSLFWQLRARGYRTTLYEPFPALFENDPTMYRILGVEHQTVPGVLAEGEKPTWRRIVHADSAAVSAMMADIARWTTADERYAILFAPQTSHAPWNDPVPGRHAPELLDRCRALVAVQDGWIASLLRALERRGRLDRTLFVVTADHGIRTKEEDPRFTPGILDGYSFHVPLMIAAPGLFDSTTVVGSVTSHVDVAPTLLDLLGVDRDRGREQGNTLWDPAVGGRASFLLAGQLFGATGFHRGGRFAQWNDVSGVVCASDGVLRCGTEHVVPGTSLEADTITASLRRFSALQKVWLEQMVGRGAPR